VSGLGGKCTLSGHWLAFRLGAQLLRLRDSLGLTEASCARLDCAGSSPSKKAEDLEEYLAGEANDLKDSKEVLVN
jgi:hypothetical protein